MLELVKTIGIDNIGTAAGFILYLVWSNNKCSKRIDDLEADRSRIYDKYIDSIHQSNKDVTEAIGILNKVISDRAG